MTASVPNLITRIPLKTEILKYSKLETRVQEWVSRANLQELREKFHLKSGSSFSKVIPRKIIFSAILYTVTKRLPGLFSDHNPNMPSISQDIKEYYSQLNLKRLNENRNDNQFYFFCVFMTKITVTFLSDTFLDLEVDKHLEAEVYITLVYVMLGLEVCPKSYDLSLKKLIKSGAPKRPIPRKNTHFSNCESVPSLASTKKMNKINHALMPLKKLLVKLTLERKCTLDIQEQPDAVQQFRTTLKENLNIKPLPKLPPKLIKASEFDHITDLSQAAKEGDQKEFNFSRRESEMFKPVRDFFESTQNSSSYELMLQKNNQTQPTHIKTVKISHRPQLINHKRNNRSIDFKSLNNLQEAKESHKKCDTGRKNWPSIIQNLKQDVTTTSKHHFKSKKTERSQENCDVVEWKDEEKEKENKKQEQSLGKMMVANQTKPSEAVTLQPKPFAFYTYWMDQPTQAKKEPLSVPSDSQHFRKLRREFDSTCEIRYKEATESMFNLNKTTTSHFRRR